MTPENNYMTPEELRAVADYCESLTPLWEAITTGSRGGISVDCGSVELKVYDSNGEQLGSILWADSGPAFYPSTEDE